MSCLLRFQPPLLGRIGDGSEGELTTGDGTNPSVYWGEGSPILSFTPALANAVKKTTTRPTSQRVPNNLQDCVLSLPTVTLQTRKLKPQVLKSFPQTTQLVRIACWARLPRTCFEPKYHIAQTHRCLLRVANGTRETAAEVWACIAATHACPILFPRWR